MELWPGNYLLMMFYTTIAGWMVQYFIKMMTGEFEERILPLL